MNTTLQSHATISFQPRIYETGRDALTDSKLLERCLCDDNAAWDEVHRRYVKRITRYAYSLCHNYEDADDIASQVFLQLYKYLDGYRKQASFLGWLFAITRNIFLDMCIRSTYIRNVSLFTSLSDKSIKEEFTADKLADPSPTPEEMCTQRETAQVVRKAVSHLPSYQRQVVQMRYFDGKDYREIATALNISIGTVKSRLNRARTMLRERLSVGQSASRAA